MGLLNIFSKEEKPSLTRLPSGSFTVDATGHVLSSTLPHGFSTSHMKLISDVVLPAFRNAQKAQAPLTELVIHFSALKITARDLRGGAIIFLAPQTPNRT